MTAPLYVWYRGAFVAIRINADTQEEKKKFIYHKNGGKRMEDYRNKTKKDWILHRMTIRCILWDRQVTQDESRRNV